jgi:AcrR family transcriptional regulator
MVFMQAVDAAIGIRRATDRRREIIAAATELFLSEGYERTSMRNIASRLNVTPTTLYLYFENKEHLLYELVRESFQTLLEDLRAAFSVAGDPVERLRDGLETYLRFGRSHPDHYRVMFTYQSYRNNRPCDASENTMCGEPLREKVFDLFLGAVERCLEKDRLSGDNASAITAMLLASIHGMTWMLSDGLARVSYDADDLVQLQIGTLISGLTKS